MFLAGKTINSNELPVGLLTGPLTGSLFQFHFVLHEAHGHFCLDRRTVQDS